MTVVVLALDTTTRSGSMALLRDGRVVAAEAGDPQRTHGERLPGDLLRLLAGGSLRLTDVDLFAVCSGPGSFTGLRVGLATIQGLAMSTGGQVVTVPTMDAIAYAACWRADDRAQPGSIIVPWMNAHRGEVFGAIYTVENNDLQTTRPAAVGRDESLLAEWAGVLGSVTTLFIGDAVDRTGVLATLKGDVRLDPEMPKLAPVIARRASQLGTAAATAPHTVRPVYVRRPDAELARDRQRNASGEPKAS